MAHVIPSIRTAPRPVYTPRPGVRGDASKTTTASVAALDFQTLLKKQPTAVVTPKLGAIPLTTATPATTPAPSPSGTIGSIMLGAPGPVNNPVVNEPAMAPTAQAMFGANPWINNAGGSGPYGSYSYNKYYFATPETASKVAQLLGGKVVETQALTPYGPFVQNQANQMVQMPDGRLINAGIIASYYDRGWSQQSVDALVKGEISGGPMVQT
jgi:hypothetical protein